VAGAYVACVVEEQTRCAWSPTEPNMNKNEKMKSLISTIFSSEVFNKRLAFRLFEDWMASG
jgi:hypothetical protein